MVGAFGDDSVEPAGGFDGACQIVIIDQFGVSEDSGCLSEEVLDGFDVFVDLVDEFVSRVEETQAVIVGFGEELDATGLCERVECADDLGAVFVELLEEDAGDAEGNLEPAIVPLDVLEQQAIGGQVALVGDLSAYLRVFELVEIGFGPVEDGVVLEPEGLMHLKIEAY